MNKVEDTGALQVSEVAAGHLLSSSERIMVDIVEHAPM